MLIKLFPAQISAFKTGSDVTFDRSSKAVVFYAIFMTTVLLWVTESLHGISSNIVALLPVAGLALTEVLEVKDIRKLPWEVLWLVAGGLALGLYMDHTGLATYLVSTIDWASLGGFCSNRHVCSCGSFNVEFSVQHRYCNIIDASCRYYWYYAG